MKMTTAPIACALFLCATSALAQVPHVLGVWEFDPQASELPNGFPLASETRSYDLRDDGYVVNAVMDAAFRSAKSGSWEPVELFEWRGGVAPRIGAGTQPQMHDGKVVIKSEVLPDGRRKMILKDPVSGDFEDRVVSA